MASVGSTYGNGNGLDVTATVDQLLYAERAPERLWQRQQATIEAQASAMRDINSRLEALESRVNALKDVNGAMNGRSVSMSGANVLTASADFSAAMGEHTIVVSKLATISSVYTDALPTADTAFTAGTLTYTVGGQERSLTLDAEHSTLKTAAEYINSGDFGVAAAIITDATGSRLVLTSKTPGSAGDLVVIGAPSGLGFHVGTKGQNAALTVDGVPLESPTNTVDGTISGVTLKLTGFSDSAVTVKVNQDAGRAKQAIRDFVSAFNDVISSVNEQFAYDPTRKTAGMLAGNSTLRSIQSELLSQLSHVVNGNGSISTLRSAGVEMKDDGTLEINATALDAAFEAHGVDVQNFFQSVELGGFAIELGARLATLTDSVDGPLLVDARGLDASSKTIDDQIEAFEARMEMRERVLLDQYTRIDALLRQLPQQLSQINAQLGALKQQ